MEADNEKENSEYISGISIEVKNLPQINVACIRHIGKFKGETEKWARHLT